MLMICDDLSNFSNYLHIPSFWPHKAFPPLGAQVLKTFESWGIVLRYHLGEFDTQMEIEMIKMMMVPFKNVIDPLNMVI